MTGVIHQKIKMSNNDNKTASTSQLFVLDSKRSCLSDGDYPETELIEKDHPGSFLRYFQNLRSSGTLFDYLLIVGDENVRVHKVVMMASSDYFNALLTTNMIEENLNSITLETIDATGLHAAVDFAYTGKVEKLNKDNLYSIITAASYLQMNSLLKLLESYLLSVMTITNCIDILHLTNIYPIFDASNTPRTFILENFKQMPYNKLRHLSYKDLLFFIKNDGLHVDSELDIVNIIKEWMEYKYYVDFCNLPEMLNFNEEPWITFTSLLKQVRWSLLKPDTLLDGLDLSLKAAMHRIPDCMNFLLEAKDYHLFPLKQHVKSDVSSRVRSSGPSFVTYHYGNLLVYDFITKQRYKEIESGAFETEIASPAVVVVNNFLFACGGENKADNNFLGTTYFSRYDPRFNTWLALPTMMHRRLHLQMVAYDNQIYAIGGSRDDAPVELTDINLVKQCEVYDLNSNSWCAIASLESGLEYHAVCIADDKIFVSGGVNEFPTASVCCYDTRTEQWEQCADMMNVRAQHVMESISKSLYVIGGRGFKDEIAIASIEKYSLDTKQWTECSLQFSPNIQGFTRCASFVFDEKIHVAFGISFLTLDFHEDTSVTEKCKNYINSEYCALLDFPKHCFPIIAAST